MRALKLSNFILTMLAGTSQLVEDVGPLGGRNVSTQRLCSKGENDDRHHER